MFRKLLLTSAFFLGIFPLTYTEIQCAENEPWKDLFNGTDFTGWNQKGGQAKYTIENGIITGTSVWGTPNSFLCTNEMYADFILEYDVWVDNRLNSGVQFRSNSFESYNNGRVHGYQCELDPSDRGWTGGIYDEARRGWLYPLSLNESARHAFKKNKWNRIRIQAIGNHITTWVNDIPATNLYDGETASGFIGLQVHSIWDSATIGTQVKWKNIRICTTQLDKVAKASTAPVYSRLVNQLAPEEQASGWKLLFDGKTSNGWRSARGPEFPAKGWKIEDGIITVLRSDGGESTNGGDIVTVDQYAAFELQVEFKITKGANSGIKYFVPLTEQTGKSAFGLEFQILDDANHPDAKLFTSFEGSRTVGSLYDLIKAENKRFESGAWNSARIVVYPNNHIEHWLNGIKVVEYDRGSEAFRALVAKSKYAAPEYNQHGRFGEAPKGHILLQDHGDEVSFRSIKIKTLN